MGTQSRRGCSRHDWPAWLSEFASTAILLLVMVTLFRHLFGAGGLLGHALPSQESRLVADAVVSGITVGLLIVSPFGRRSGGHMNPAVSLAFWLMGALPGRDAAAYAAAQLAGSLTGVAVGRLVWGEQTAHRAVGYAVVRASDRIPWTAVFASEAAATAVMLAAVTFVAARARLAIVLPAVAGSVIAALILLTGRWTGGSFNPARQFGPELFSHDLAWLWVYLIAPLVGGGLFGLVRRCLPHAPALPTSPAPAPAPAPGVAPAPAPAPAPGVAPEVACRPHAGLCDGPIRGEYGPEAGHGGPRTTG
ncbi:aquaporin [Streptomyces sp. 142MFCol3.1]|uniref:aquaporin n=1 Tax=Streptomyces sp. 142MFCol3.1 TaxID=1172179 RepID=UPI0003F71C4E|nr:aquaporin [Streptomyces sp. 142MFCol3.1]